MQKPLDGLRVVDVTHVLAGPYCTYQLGLLGAEIIKVESTRGDMVRGWSGTKAQLDAGLGAGFSAQNAGKKSISVDIREPEGEEIVRQLASTADVFVENFRPGALARRGLGADALMARSPRLIYASISAFGHTGPEGPRPGFDDVLQARGGYMSQNERGDGPIRTGGPVLDYATGMQAASAILAAVMLRDKTGQGQRVDVAMQDVTLLLMNRQTHIAATTGEDLAPPGNREGPMLGRFATRDGYVMLAGYLPHHCRSICAALELDQYAHLNGRTLADQADEIEAAVAQRLSERTSAEWDAVFSERGVVAGAVRSIAEVFAGGQPRARQLTSEVPSAAGPMQVTNAGYLINGESLEPDGAVPLLGEHTAEILAELGYDAESIETLREAGVVSHPAA